MFITSSGPRNSILNTKESDIILKNICEKKNLEISFSKCDGYSRNILQKQRNILTWNQLDYIKAVMKEIFLPEGYPDSVSDDYLEYQLWDTCQAFCSSISGTLSMSAVMAGVGVGSNAATPVSAAVTWIMKDGTGMVGSILFAWFKGSRLDSECKKWRLFADVLNDFAMCLELYIPQVIEYSVELLCLSTAMKALVGVAGSATRAALTCHQAIQGNMADVSAKDGSQEIFVNLCAYLVGILILKNITEPDKVWATMCIFILLHLFSNYKAVSCLKINVYNAERYRLSLRSFLATSDVPTVEQVNRNESVFFGRGTTDQEVFGFDIHLGKPFEDAVMTQELTAEDLSFLVSMFQSKNYLLIPHEQKKRIFVTFRKKCNDMDVLKGYFHASLLAAAMKLVTGDKSLPILKRRRNNSPVSRIDKILKGLQTNKKAGYHQNSTLPLSALLACEQATQREFSLFSKLSSEQGWIMGKNSVIVDNWKAEWKFVVQETDSDASISKKRGSVAERRKTLTQARRQQQPNPKQAVNFNRDPMTFSMIK